MNSLVADIAPDLVDPNGRGKHPCLLSHRTDHRSSVFFQNKIKMSPSNGSLNLNGSRTPLKLAFTYDSQAHWQEEEGFTEEQCLEFLAEETIEAIAVALRKLGTVEMIGGIKALAKRLTSSKVDWDLVFNLSEGHGTIGREAQVPALLEAWNIPFTLSDSATMALCLDKAKTKVRSLISLSAV
jgi:D-alanine-D-alanine ligase-like ATP-grasp enzyme